jgi:hypothetical protein
VGSEVSTRDWGSAKVSGEIKSPKMSNKILGKATKEAEVVYFRNIGGRHRSLTSRIIWGFTEFGRGKTYKTVRGRAEQFIGGRIGIFEVAEQSSLAKK